jgi:DNA-binding Lrp family transcriptional regulator
MIEARKGKEARLSLGKQRILQMLQEAPQGLTTVELAKGLAASPRDVGGRLSKLAAYGEIEKLKGLLHPVKTKWRLNQNWNGK